MSAQSHMAVLLLSCRWYVLVCFWGHRDKSSVGVATEVTFVKQPLQQTTGNWTEQNSEIVSLETMKKNKRKIKQLFGG